MKHPPNDEKLVICRAIFLAAGIFVVKFLSAWHVNDLASTLTLSPMIICKA